MIEKILTDVMDAMTPYLDKRQMEKLKDVLYISFSITLKYGKNVMSCSRPAYPGTR